MKKFFIFIATLGLISSSLYAKQQIKQTLCFSKSSCSDQYAYGVLGEKVHLCDGKCQGKTLLQMNKEGWRLVQVISGLNNSFGMLLEKK